MCYSCVYSVCFYWKQDSFFPFEYRFMFNRKYSLLYISSIGFTVFTAVFKCFSGNDGDDFLVLGIRRGRVVHKFNLGSGIATIVSDRLNHQISIHTVVFGRSKRTGWLKVIYQHKLLSFLEIRLQEDKWGNHKPSEQLQCSLAKCLKSKEHNWGHS